jgi:S1-C subfamily serine protease
MNDDFFDEDKGRKGISITFFIVVILLIALLSSTITYFFVPTYKVSEIPQSTPLSTPTRAPEKVVIEGDMEAIFTSLYENNCDVVTVIDGFVTQNGKEMHYNQSSGFIISEDGYILTNHHCVNGIEKIVVTLYNGEEYDAEIIGTDDRTEVAVIKINAGKKLKAATLGDSDKIKIGQYAVAIGNPVGFEYSMSIGFVSGVEREVDAGAAAPLQTGVSQPYRRDPHLPRSG